MNRCWKCGRNVEFGSECRYCVAEDMIGQKHEIDWSKVKSLEDMKIIMSAIMIVTVEEGSPSFEKLKRFLK